MSDDTTTTTAAAGAKPVKFPVKQLLDASKVQTDLAYSVVDISAGLMEQSALFVHYGSIAAQASAQVDSFKLRLETTEAKVTRSLRDEYAKTSEKISEARLDKEIILNPVVIALKEAVNEAKQIESASKTVVEAFRHRRDMLVQQGLLLREEMKGEASIKVREGHASAAEAQRERILGREAERLAHAA